jgi:anti-sigma B factor antagonist
MSEAAENGLQIEVTQTEGSPVLVALVGELDLVSASAFIRAVADLQPLLPTQVVIDLSGLTFVDSSGVNALVQAVRAVEADGGGAVLAAPSAPTRRVLEITRAGEIVPIVADRQAALAHVAPGPRHDTAADDVR